MHPSRPALRRAVGALALLFVGGCANQATLYSRDLSEPLGEHGWDEVNTILFEDDRRRELRDDENLTVVGDEIVLSRGDRTRAIDPSTIQTVRIEGPDGVDQWIEILTPDDLDRFDRMPLVESIELRDGRRIDFDPEDTRTVAWSPSRLGLVVGEATELESGREILLEDVRTVRLRPASSLGTTLRSPRFWIAGVAAAGAVVLIGRTVDTENTATR